MKPQLFWQRLFSVFVLVGMLFGLVQPAGVLAAGQTTPVQQKAEIKIEQKLLDQFQAKGSAGYLVYFSEKPDLSPAYKMDWTERGWFVMNALQDTSKRSQAGVQSYLDSQRVAYQSFWIDNILSVKSSDIKTLNGLFDFGEIVEIKAQRMMGVIEPEMVSASGTTLAIEPNLLRVNADDVWGLGITGAGIVVSNIDTGALYTHNALNSSYRGNLGGGSYEHNYNWFDPYITYSSPADSNGHGTHTMGTIVGHDGGSNQIGMAPGAEWIACRGCSTSSCGDAELLACAQFVAAPTNLAGLNPDPAQRAHVVNNSWGDCGTSYDNWYQGVIDSWHAAGVYPVFSNGNASNCGYSAPPGLNTVGNPARYGNVTGVGSTGQSDGTYAPHSNWGPTDNPDTINPRGYPNLKPQVLAPGVSIRSSVPSSPTAYLSYTGTSMSAPHVAGLLALVWEAAPCLIGDYEATETLIEMTATPLPYASGGSPAPGPGNVPNYATGWGEIDALAAVTAATMMCGDASIEGTVASSGLPLAGAKVTVTGGSETRIATTAVDGTYRLAVYAGTYDLTASMFGYLPQTIEGVFIEEGETEVVDFSLVQAPSALVSGSVYDVNTGWPLYSQIAVSGAPVQPFWTNPVDGTFSLLLPVGGDYSFTANAWVSGYQPTTETVSNLTGDTNIELELDVNQAACNAPGYSLSGGICTPQPGGLVVGQVRDDNTGAYLPGAVVSNAAGTGVAWITADPNVEDAFFTIFAPAGSVECTVALPGSRYNERVEDVTVLLGGTVEHDFSLPAGELVVNPGALVVSLPLGSLASVSLEATNTGSVDLTYEIREKDLGFAPILMAGEDVLVVRYDTNAAGALEGALTTLGISFLGVTDSTYRAMPVNDLLEYQAVFYLGAIPGDSIPVTTAYLDAGGNLFIADNDLGYFRSTTPFYQTYLQSTYNVDDAGDILTGEGIMAGLILDVTSDPWPDGFTVGGEGLRIFQYESGYAGGVAVERNGYRAVYLSFDFHHLSNLSMRSSLIERVVDFLMESDVDWLSVDLIAGEILAGDSETIEVTFDATSISVPGDYLAQLILKNNTPYGKVVVPVTMSVQPPASFGKLKGVVTGMGYCDENYAPLKGAVVFIESETGDEWITTTDASGYYQFWLDEMYSPLTVTVSYEAGYAAETISDVEITGGVITNEDFFLRMIATCIEVEPVSLDSILVMGASETLPVTILNHGSITLTYQIDERDGGFIPPTVLALPSGEAVQPVAPALSSAEKAETGNPVGEVAPSAVPEDIGLAWETMASLPSGRVFSAVIADDNGFVYVIGGTSDGAATGPSNTVYRYETFSNTWNTMSPLPAAMDSIDGAVINNKIYIPGNASSAVTYVYDIAGDSWSTLAPGDYSPRSQYQVVTIGTDLYVLGGIVASSSASTNEVWILDTTTGVWSVSAPMQRSRTSFSAGVINGVIYVAGGVAFPGFLPDMTAEKFDGAAWSYIAGVPSGGGAYTRWSYNADAVGELGLWLAAGRRDNDWAVLNHAGYYDPSTDTWTTSPAVPVMSQGRVYMEGDVASDGYLYVIGGRDAAGAIAYATNERLFVGLPLSPHVDWLDAAPIEGVVAPDGGSAIVDVTIDTASLTEPGTYLATLRIKSNDKGGIVNVPVSLEVEAPVYGVNVGQDMEDSAEPGKTKVYPVTVKNMGNMPDTYNLTVSGHSWTTEINKLSVTLLPGQEEVVNVSVDIPAGVLSGTWDMTTFKAVSVADPDREDDCLIKTTAMVVLSEEADLSVEITVSPRPVIFGQSTTFTAVVSNAGPNNSTAVVVSGELPVNVEFVSSVHCAVTDGLLTCNLGTIESGASKTAVVMLRFLAAGTFEGALEASSEVTDPDLTNNIAGFSIEVEYLKVYVPLLNKK